MSIQLPPRFIPSSSRAKRRLKRCILRTISVLLAFSVSWDGYLFGACQVVSTFFCADANMTCKSFIIPSAWSSLYVSMVLSFSWIRPQSRSMLLIISESEPKSSCWWLVWVSQSSSLLVIFWSISIMASIFPCEIDDTASTVLCIEDIWLFSVFWFSAKDVDNLFRAEVVGTVIPWLWLVIIRFGDLDYFHWLSLVVGIQYSRKALAPQAPVAEAYLCHILFLWLSA